MENFKDYDSTYDDYLITKCMPLKAARSIVPKYFAETCKHTQTDPSGSPIGPEKCEQKVKDYYDVKDYNKENGYYYDKLNYYTQPDCESGKCYDRCCLPRFMCISSQCVCEGWTTRIPAISRRTMKWKAVPTHTDQLRKKGNRNTECICSGASGPEDFPESWSSNYP